MKRMLNVAYKLLENVGNKLTFENVVNYLDKNGGWKIVFSETAAGDKYISDMFLEKYAADNISVTVSNKSCRCIIINNSLSSEDKFHMLLHETAHILLGHIDKLMLLAQNSKILDNEAEALVYFLQHFGKGRYYTYSLLNRKRNIFIATLASVSLVTGILITTQNNIVPGDAVSEAQMPVPTNQAEKDISLETPASLSDMVFITPTGEKYHCADCHTINKETATMITVEKARLSYEPCSLCDPDRK